MNYFGHAAIAGKWPTATTEFVFGAMLPDLAHFVDGKISKELPGALGEGVRFHLDTDAVFHENERFENWHLAALAMLRERNVTKGPARAASHVGIEMLIDDALARNQQSRSVYREALEFGARSSARLVPSCGVALAEVCGRLLEFVGALGEKSPARLELRLFRALASHPRLRPNAFELALIVGVLSEYRATIESESDLLVDEIALGLRAKFGPVRSDAIAP